jgi:putative protein-disulfide isomerase
MAAKLHYIYDPLCGWCYGAEPLVLSAIKVEGLDLVLHGGGLWPEPSTLPEDMCRYIQKADKQIGVMSGQPYGDEYLNGLLLDPSLVLESQPTIAAVLATKSIDPAKEMEMLKAIQHAHYEHGRHVVNSEVIAELAEQCGLDSEAFSKALGEVDVDAHIAESRQLMGRIGAGGFPTFVLETDAGLQGVPHQQYGSNPQGFAEWLSQKATA